MAKRKAITFFPENPELWDRMRTEYNEQVKTGKKGYEPLMEAMLKYCHAQQVFVPTNPAKEVVSE